MDSSGAVSCANLQEKMREVTYICKIPVERVDGEGRGTTCRTCRACRTRREADVPGEAVEEAVEIGESPHVPRRSSCWPAVPPEVDCVVPIHFDWTRRCCR